MPLFRIREAAALLGVSDDTLRRWKKTGRIQARSIPFNAAAQSGRTDRIGEFKFRNDRAAAWWKMRELLDPSQPGGSPAALPPSRLLLQDLTAPTFEITPRGIAVESKEDVCERLGRSTDEGDATVMANWGGARMASHYQQWKQRSSPPKVVMGRVNARRRS